MSNIYKTKVGPGVLCVEEGDSEYGQTMIYLLVERNGQQYELPIATIENPNNPAVDSPATDANATTLYIYRSLNSNEFTDKIKIPNSIIDTAIAEIDEAKGA